MSKNLIIFSYDFPPSDGGIARLCQEISVGSLKYYNKVIVLTRKKDGISKPYNSTDRINIKEVDSRRGYCEIQSYKFLKAIKNKRNYDILCGLWHPEATITLLAGFKNVYILAHGTELLAGNSNLRCQLWLPLYAKRVLKKAKLVIANSCYTEQLVKRVSPKANSMALPLAVNHNFFRPKKKKKDDFLNICTVSRIHKFKGHDLILKTIANLPIDYQSKIRYNIAGTGNYLDSLKKLVEEFGLNDIVRFFGFVPDDALPDFYNANDLFILCTRETESSTAVEGFGLVFLEAQACALPVIGTRTGGIPDAVKDGDGGWLIEQDNEEELSCLLKKLIDQTSTVQDMGIKARLRVEKEATWEHYCDNLFNQIRL